MMADKKLVRFDWALKYILRNKANFDVLEGFLSNLLKEDIKVLDILESESNREAEQQKFNRVDLKCIDSQDRQIIVEIQNEREVDYLQRLLWGTSRAVVESLELGRSYGEVVKVISISILYHTMRADEQENADFIYHGTTELTGIHTKKPLILHQAVVRGNKTPIVTSKEVFPEYYMIYVEKFEDMIHEDLDEWIYFFKHGAIREDFRSPGIHLAAKKLDYLTMSEAQRRAYDDYLAYLGQEIGILEAAKIDGRAEGRAEGRKEGSEERLKEVVHKLQSKGFSPDTIAEMLEIPMEEILKATGESNG